MLHLPSVIRFTVLCFSCLSFCSFMSLAFIFSFGFVFLQRAARMWRFEGKERKTTCAFFTKIFFFLALPYAALTSVGIAEKQSSSLRTVCPFTPSPNFRGVSLLPGGMIYLAVGRAHTCKSPTCKRSASPRWGTRVWAAKLRKYLLVCFPAELRLQPAVRGDLISLLLFCPLSVFTIYSFSLFFTSKNGTVPPWDTKTNRKVMKHSHF